MKKVNYKEAQEEKPNPKIRSQNPNSSLSSLPGRYFYLLKNQRAPLASYSIKQTKRLHKVWYNHMLPF